MKPPTPGMTPRPVKRGIRFPAACRKLVSRGVWRPVRPEIHFSLGSALTSYTRRLVTVFLSPMSPWTMTRPKRHPLANPSWKSSPVGHCVVGKKNDARSGSFPKPFRPTFGGLWVPLATAIGLSRP